MNHYASNTTIAELAHTIAIAQRVLLTTHAKPDGDAMGSVLALARGLAQQHKAADIFLEGPIESNLLTIAAPTPFRDLHRHQPGDDYDLCIVVDTGAWSQLEQITPWLKQHHEITVGIDHHTRGDDVAAVRLVEPTAVSTTAVLLPLLDAMHCKITGEAGGVGEALFVGLATDSGWFRYGNAGVEAFEMAARLLESGVDKSRLYQILEETFGPQRLALEARALASLEYVKTRPARATLANGLQNPDAFLVAIQSLRQRDFQETGASLEDLTGLVNTPMTVGAVRASILFSQIEDGKTKISFRSKPAAPGHRQEEFIDVNLLAQKFGGGGHIYAAGARINKNLDDAKAQVVATLTA
jgi:phosphoesterase RecJ-like protein